MQAGVSESHFVATTGYGYGDRGRDVLDAVYAYALGAEDALCRYNFVSGTHTLTVALFGVLRPGDTMLSVTGMPYDTLQGVIGLSGESCGSLKEFGVNYEQVDLLPDGTPDYAAMETAVTSALPHGVYPALARVQPAPVAFGRGDRPHRGDREAPRARLHRDGRQLLRQYCRRLSRRPSAPT